MNNATSITVTWMTPAVLNGNITRYELTLSSSSPSALGQGNFSIITIMLEYTASSLSPFTEYTFEAAAVTGAGRGASVTVTVRTDEDGNILNTFFLLAMNFFFFFTAPSAPTLFTLSPVFGNPEQLEASWAIPDPANGIIQSYTVVCNDSLVFHFNASDNAVVTFLLTGLRPFTVYDCAVFATTGGGMGIASDSSIDITEEDG